MSRHFGPCVSLIAIMCFLPAAFTQSAVQPRADETGMVPGDIVLGNMTSFPGHAGIYIGKWRNLPQELQTKYAGAFAKAVIYSYDDSLRDSYLVVDSYAPRVAIRSFAEQFTDYFTGQGQRVLKPTGALRFEGGKGAAVEWLDPSIHHEIKSSLPLNDPRRWQVIEEALKCADIGVKYDSNFEGLTFEDYSIKWPMQWAKYSAKDESYRYEEMTMDCITFVHVAYFRGAGIHLQAGRDSLAWPLTPGEIDAAAEQSTPWLKRYMKRAVLHEPVYVEAVLQGKWQGALWVKQNGQSSETPCALEIAVQPGGIAIFTLDAQSLQRKATPALEGKLFPYQRDQDDRLIIHGIPSDFGSFRLISGAPDTLTMQMEDSGAAAGMGANLKKIRRQTIKIDQSANVPAPDAGKWVAQIVEHPMPGEPDRWGTRWERSETKLIIHLVQSPSRNAFDKEHPELRPRGMNNMTGHYEGLRQNAEAECEKFRKSGPDK